MTLTGDDRRALKREVDRRRRANLAAHVREMRDAGMTHAAIAAALGLSRSYAAELDADPTGAATRARKDSYRGRCENCGAATDGSNGRAAAPKLCDPCARAKQHDERRWTRQAIIAEIRAWADEHGDPPLATDWLRGRNPGETFPAPSLAIREFGSWADAIEAAGFPRPAVGAYNRDGLAGTSRKQRQILAALIDRPLTVMQIDAGKYTFASLAHLRDRGLVRQMRGRCKCCGHKVTTWALTDQGRQAAEALQ